MTAPLATLEEQLHPAHTALLVVDLQNDFCAAGGFLQRARAGTPGLEIQVEANTRVAERIGELAGALRAAGGRVVWVRSHYDFKYLKAAHIAQRKGIEGLCMEGSWGAGFFHLSPAEGELVLDKHTFSAFHGTTLDGRLREMGIRTLVIAGVATNVCIDSTLREGFFLGYYVVIPEDGVGSGNAAGHEGTLSTVRVNFGAVLPAADIRRHWPAAGAG